MSDEHELEPVGNLKDCAACYARIPKAAIVREAPALPAPERVRKPRSKGKGSFCVLSHRGRVVHCYESEATAHKIADAFTKRGRTGARFTVENRAKQNR